jgi:hypothetical protein
MKSNGGSTLDAIVTQHGFADLPDVRFAFDIAGQGDSVIFLHGGLLGRRT